MEIEEAIKHCREVASNQNTCKECSNEHLQLLEWLVELQQLREFRKEIVQAVFKADNNE